MPKINKIPNKMKSAFADLETCMKDNGKTRVLTLAKAKAFEIALEYTWKWFKLLAQEEGIEIQTPKDAIRSAAQIKLISDVELWLKFMDARNYAVHDYLGIDEETYHNLIEEFYKESIRIQTNYA